MPSREDIVCFAGDNYRFSNPHSRYHIMHALHRRGHRILWVDSIGMNMPKVRRSGFTRRVLMRLRSWVRCLHKVDQGFHVLTPIALPLFGNPALEQINARWISFQVKVAMLISGIRNPLVFASIPSFAPVALSMRKAGLIYYYSDKYDSYRDIAAYETISFYDKALFAAADAVFCASERIADPLKAERDNVHYLPHAVDFVHFSRPSQGEPEVVRQIPHPRVGYFGSLTDSNDISLIRDTAIENPDLQFVLIGRVLGDYSSIEELPNVHMIGFVPYVDLPAYGQSFDVGFMAWKMTDWIRHSNPLKTKEYLSLGLPVASVRIAELENNLAEFVEFFDDAGSFAEAIRSLLQKNNPSLSRKRRETARSDSWDRRVEEMIELYRKAVGT